MDQNGESSEPGAKEVCVFSMHRAIGVQIIRKVTPQEYCTIMGIRKEGV